LIDFYLFHIWFCSVGQNGSGKSNLFSAIQFVLSPELLHLTREQRETLLHASGAGRARSAFVEIVFSNEDMRMPVSSRLSQEQVVGVRLSGWN